MTLALLRVSASDARRHPGQMLVAVVALVVGVAAFVSVQSAHDTLQVSLAESVTRLAGEADLQITGADGVAEVQETLRTLPVVASVQPLIEQVVELDDRTEGALLVMAVDLAGDKRGGEFGLETNNAEVEDSLAFIAQPDSIAITRDFAGRAGLRIGDTFTIHAGALDRRVTVRALMSPRGFAEAYGGNVAVMDVYAAQTMLGRGRTFDRMDVMLQAGVETAEGQAQIEHALGAAYRIDAPERRAVQLQQRTNAVVAGFDFIAMGALALGILLVNQVYLVALQRRRRSIGILRAIGATPAQIAGMFLGEALLLGTIGGLLGVALGHVLSARSIGLLAGSLDASRGMVAGHATTPRTVLLPGLLVGCLAAGLGLLLPARAAGRLKPVDAIATGVFAASTVVVPTWLITLVGMLSAYVVTLQRLATMRGVRATAALAAMVAVVMLASRLARWLAASAGRRLPQLTAATGAIAGDSLQAPRRTTMTAAVIIASATFTLGLGGYMLAIQASFDGWVNNVMTADLYVRASSGWGPARVHLPESLGATIIDTPGVAAIDAFRQEALDFQGRSVMLMAVDSERYAVRVPHTIVDGDQDAFAALRTGATCIVTDDFARLFGLRAGDRVPLDPPAGHVDLTIAGVVTGDRHVVIVDRSLFAAHWRPARDAEVDVFAVSVAPGADAAVVQRALRSRLAGLSPAFITTRQAFINEMHRSLALAFAIMRGIILLALIVTVLSAGLSQLAVAAERARDIAILKALGAVPAQIGAAALLESATVTLAALVVAVPLGDLNAWVMRVRVSQGILGFELDRIFPWLTFLTLAAGLPLIGAIVSWLPAWRLASRRVSETLSND